MAHNSIPAGRVAFWKERYAAADLSPLPSNSGARPVPPLLTMPMGNVGGYGGCSSRHNPFFLHDHTLWHGPGTLQCRVPVANEAPALS